MTLDRLVVPSGTEYDTEDLEIVAKMREFGTVEYNPKGFTLKSGVQSFVYVQGRGDVTDNPELGWLLGRKVAQTIVTNHLETDKVPFVIGIPTAATSIAAATSLVSYAERIHTRCGPIRYRIMREAVKEHGGGATNWVNGKPRPECDTYYDLDNVVTDGGSKFEAEERFRASGYPFDDMVHVILVDRQQGGVKRMQDRGYRRIIVVYNLLDITFALGRLRLWPEELVGQVEEEIHAHQFV